MIKQIENTDSFNCKYSYTFYTGGIFSLEEKAPLIFLDTDFTEEMIETLVNNFKIALQFKLGLLT